MGASREKYAIIYLTDKLKLKPNLNWTTMEKKIFNLCLRSLIYKEEGLFHARCLEMDLLGVGESEKEALRELQTMVEGHISFAVYKKDDRMLMFPADQKYFERWEKANQAKIHNELFPNKAVSDTAVLMNGRAVVITIEKQELLKLKKPQQFNSVQEPVFA
jgi:hypothetical protein